MTARVIRDVKEFANHESSGRARRCKPGKMEVRTGVAVKRGGKYCVAGSSGDISCQNTSYTHGVSMHKFPKYEETRRKWTNFVRKHRPKFSPSSASHLCSVHFKPTCFTRRQDIEVEGITFIRTLQSGAIPTEDTVITAIEKKKKEPSARERRQVGRVGLYISLRLFSTSLFLLHLSGRTAR